MHYFLFLKCASFFHEESLVNIKLEGITIKLYRAMFRNWHWWHIQHFWEHKLTIFKKLEFQIFEILLLNLFFLISNDFYFFFLKKKTNTLLNKKLPLSYEILQNVGFLRFNLVILHILLYFLMRFCVFQINIKVLFINGCSI